MNQSAVPIRATEKPSARVLVVDDERLVADTLALILKQHGFDVRAVYSGAEAIDMAKQFRPDLLLIDVLMPEMDGIELAMRVRQLNLGAEVLLFSGYSGTTDLLDSARERGYDFEIVAKPIAPPELLAKIEKLTARRQTQESHGH